MIAVDDARTLLINKWLTNHWKNNRLCPLCGNPNWTIRPDPMEIREYKGGGIIIGGNIKTLVLVTILCNVCGYTFFINAEKLETQAKQAKKKE